MTPAKALQNRMKVGSATAKEIYVSVGLALSYWEGSEDMIMGVFKSLCAKTEPVAFETYVRSNRANRTKMLKRALSTYSDYYTDDESDAILLAVAELNKLAPVRNQIAHGHCSKQRSTQDGKLVMDGHYLVPSVNENGDRMLREQRYALSAVEIDEWRDAVRDQRGTIMDIYIAAGKRAQDSNN